MSAPQSPRLGPAADFTGRTVLVTGAAGMGIGQATALSFARQGATVVVTDSHAERTRRVTEEMRVSHGDRVIGHQLRVGDHDQTQRVVSAVVAETGRLDVVVNSAALNVVSGIWDTTPTDFEAVLGVNLVGAWWLARTAVPYLRAHRGCLVHMASVAPELAGAAVEAPYAASKAGVIALSRGIARAEGPNGVRSNVVSMSIVTGTRFVDVHHPHLLDTEGANMPLDLIPSAEDVAAAAVFLSSPAARAITGAILDVNSGYYMRT